MKRLTILLLFCVLFFLEGQGRIARFYFNKAYLCSCEADRYDTPVSGTFIITFDTDKKTVSVYYNVEGVKPYQFTTTYSSVNETHSPGQNADYYTLSGAGYVKDSYMLVNTYDKRTKTYGINFSTANFFEEDLFAKNFISDFFGAPSDWNSWPEVFFEKPYKMDNTPYPDYSARPYRAAGSTNSLTSHIFSGICHTNVDEYMESTMTVHFISNTKCRTKITTKVNGSDDILPLQIIQMMMEANEENSHEEVSEYTYSNGIIKIKGSTDRFRVLEGGQKLRWYVESSDERAKQFNATLTKIR